jgi:hypothetical protein
MCRDISYNAHSIQMTNIMHCVALAIQGVSKDGLCVMHGVQGCRATSQWILCYHMRADRLMSKNMNKEAHTMRSNHSESSMGSA